ncbi:unnamed protein product [Ambrosiozyma monospora]|uniref:Unnamed protein product n=1 Tax=Ambrosiozyma monospora TaxID=43982 RepID=A0A9W7DJ09_AMBMO|nr:unnamed protein product [Ambrosiozyma monospora]
MVRQTDRQTDGGNCRNSIWTIGPWDHWIMGPWDNRFQVQVPPNRVHAMQHVCVHISWLKIEMLLHQLRHINMGTMQIV